MRYRPATTANTWMGRLAALMAVALVHAGALAWVTSEPPEALQQPPRPIMVSLIQAVAPEAAVPTIKPLQAQPPEPEAKPEPELKPPEPAPKPRPKPKPEPEPEPEPKPEPKPKPKPKPTREPAPKPEPAVVPRPEPAAIAPPPVETPPPATAPAASIPSAMAVEAVTAPEFRAAYLNNPPPSYPRASIRRHEEGEVLLRVRVDPDGRATKVQLERTSGSDRLDEAAMDAVRRWQFVPAKRGERAIAATVIVPIKFQLER